jgi:hypothetical protein
MTPLPVLGAAGHWLGRQYRALRGWVHSDAPALGNETVELAMRILSSRAGLPAFGKALYAQSGSIERFANISLGKCSPVALRDGRAWEISALISERFFSAFWQTVHQV